MEKKKPDFKKDILEWVLSIIIAVVIALLLRTYVFEQVKVIGSSMEPTLKENDRLVAVKLKYNPKQGDIIILNPPKMIDGPYIKRIIAVGGQTVNIDYDSHKVYVDNKELKEDYIKEPTSYKGDVSFPIKIPKDYVFVMGDNRNESKDSRISSVGLIPNNKILGKVIIRIWPLDKFGLI